jgi:hypothetical protein
LVIALVPLVGSNSKFSGSLSVVRCALWNTLRSKPQNRNLQTVQHAKRACCNALLRDIFYLCFFEVHQKKNQDMKFSFPKHTNKQQATSNKQQATSNKQQMLKLYTAGRKR